MIAGEEGDANPASRTSSPQAHWGQGIAVALCFAILQLLVAIPPALPCPALPDTRVLSSRSPFLESQHIGKTDGEKQSAPGLRPTTPWPMEEEAEKEEKTQQHAVAMVLEQSEGEGRGQDQDPATLCASSWEPEPSNDAEIDAATYAIALTVRATRTLSRSPLS